MRPAQAVEAVEDSSATASPRLLLCTSITAEALEEVGACAGLARLERRRALQ